MHTEQDGREDRGIIHDTLALLASFGMRRPWLVLALTLFTCVASIYTSCRYLTFHTQRNDLISPTKDYYQKWQSYVAEFGDDDDMVVVVEGKDRPRMELALEDLARQVAAKPELFDRLFYKVDLRNLRNRSLLFLSHEQIRQVQHKIGKFWPLLNLPVVGAIDRNFAWQMLSVNLLMHEARKRAVALMSKHDEETQDLAQISEIIHGAGEYLRAPSTYRDRWDNPMPIKNCHEDHLGKVHYVFCEDGSLATLVVRPMKELDGFTFAQKSIDGLRAILASTQSRFPDLKLGLTGLPVLENDEMIASQNDSNLASWLALIGVAVLYLVVYRGFCYPLMTVVTLLVGTTWALGWTTLTVGHLNILSSAFAVMLIGMGDYGVLWVTRFNQERQHGESLENAVNITAVSVGSGILTAALTTALAFFATMLADLKAVAELGWIAGCGVLLCALSCFIVMPALVTLFDRRFGKSRSTDAPPILSLAEVKEQQRQWLPFLTHRPQWVIPVCLGITLILVFAALWLKYDHNLLHMQAPNLASVQWEKKLIERNTGTSWHALSYTSTPEEALALQARFEKQPGVSKVTTVAELVPRDQQRKIEQLLDIQQKLRRLPERGKILSHDLPDVDGLIQSARNLAKDLDGAEQGSVLFKLRQNLLFLCGSIAAAGSDAGTRLKLYDERISFDLNEKLHRLRDVSTPAPIEIADVPVSLRERFIGKNGKWLLRVFAKESLWEYDNLEKFVNTVTEVDRDATGKPFTTLEGLKAMKNGFFWAGIYAFIAMVIVLLLDFGNCKHTLIALAPLLMGLLATLGLMVLCGISLNPANMIAFPLVLGVGADNGVHVLHDYRTRPRDRRYTLNFTTGWGIMVAALTTILGFGTLMISQHRGMKSLGQVLTLGVTCCMFTALVLLPTILRLVSQRGKDKVQAHEVPPAGEQRRSA